MFGIAIEYHPAAGESANPAARAACSAVMVCQPGYRRRLALMADGWRRIVDLYLFADEGMARAALASDAWRALAAAHPACRTAGPALLVDECPYGGPVVLLRGRMSPTRGGQACWRDKLVATDPGAVLW